MWTISSSSSPARADLHVSRGAQPLRPQLKRADQRFAVEVEGVLEVAGRHRREHRLSALGAADDLRGDHRHHHAAERFPAVFGPRPIVVDLYSVALAQRRRVLGDEVAFDAAYNALLRERFAATFATNSLALFLSRPSL